MADTRQILDNMPLAAGMELIYPLLKADYHYSCSVHTPAAWDSIPFDDLAKKPTVLYFHGSGSTGHVAANDPIATACTQREMMFIAVRDFDTGTSSGTPWANGYGNVHSPIYFPLQIKNAWRVQAAIELARNMFGMTGDIILLGHSNGCAAIYSWSMLSGTPGFSDPDEVACIVGNGFTMGGLDANKWNLVMRNINVVSQVVSKCKHRGILFYANNDGYCPPDFARRVQASLPPDSQVNVISPGEYTHNWLALRLDFWANLMVNLLKGEPLVVNGAPVIPGAG